MVYISVGNKLEEKNKTDANIVKYEFDFDNGGSYDYYETPTYYPDGAFNGKTTHVYCDANTYTAKLRVKNSDNYYDTDTDTVVIEFVPLVVYTYDAVGNRLSVTEDDDSAVSYGYDDIYQPDANIIYATYTYGNDLIAMNRADANSYYHYDGLGSTRQLTGDSGTVVISYTYDGFGNLIASSGTSDNVYGFTGEQQFA